MGSKKKTTLTWFCVSAARFARQMQHWCIIPALLTCVRMVLTIASIAPFAARSFYRVKKKREAPWENSSRPTLFSGLEDMLTKAHAPRRATSVLLGWAARAATVASTAPFLTSSTYGPCGKGL